MKASLAKGLVLLFPPKHHLRAARILDEVLKAHPDNVSCLVSKAHVFQYGEKWHEAETLWRQVIQLVPNQGEAHFEALEERAWCQIKYGSLDCGMDVLQTVKEKYDAMDGIEYKKARVWWRIGKCKWDLGGNAFINGLYTFV